MRRSGTRILEAPNNRISIAIDMSFLLEGKPKKRGEEEEKEKRVRDSEERGLTFFGSALFRRRCSGLRVVSCHSSSSPPPTTASSSSSLPSSACSRDTEQAANEEGKGAQETEEEKREDERGRDEAKQEEQENRKSICGHLFTNYGSHCENFPVSYCTVAVALGKKKKKKKKGGKEKKGGRRRKALGHISWDRYRRSRAFA